MNMFFSSSYSRLDSIALIFATLFILFFAASPGGALAAAIPEFALDTNPVGTAYAGDLVTVTVTPNNFTASTTYFEWFVQNGTTPVASGYGLASYSFKAPLMLAPYVIKVRVNPGPGFDIKEDGTGILITPSNQYQDTTQKLISPDGSFNVGAVMSNFKLSANPSQPNPGEEVTVSVDSFSFEKERSNFDWYVNGKFIRDASGVGKSYYTFTAGSLGSSYAVQAKITLPNGIANSKTLTIQVVDLSFYWWTNTYIPPWYKGKALPTAGSPVSIMAIANTPGLDASRFIYTWTINNSLMPNSSGTGKNIYSYTQEFPDFQDRVSVLIENYSKTVSKEKTFLSYTTNPRINFYAVSPALGEDTPRVLTRLEAGMGSSVSVLAEPFFYPQGELPLLAYTWQVNGKNIQTTGNQRPNFLTIQPGEDQGASGSSDQLIFLNIVSTNRFQVRLSSSFTLQYK